MRTFAIGVQSKRRGIRCKDPFTFLSPTRRRRFGRLTEECPIVGAYLVCCAPTSVLVNLFAASFWQHGWRGEVEYTVQNHIGPLRKEAQRVIHSHRFVIRELMHFPGVVKPNDDNINAMIDSIGQTRMAGFGVEALAD